MSNAAKSIVAYGVYLIAAIGLPFLLIPDLLLPLVGMHTPTDVWIRVLGMSVLFFGVYYIQAGRHELTAVLPLDHLRPLRGAAVLYRLCAAGLRAAHPDRLRHPRHPVHNLDRAGAALRGPGITVPAPTQPAG